MARSTLRITILRWASALALAASLGACGDGRQAQEKPTPPPPAVTVANPVERTITDMDQHVGRFVAVNSVEMRSRVSGYLDKVHFEDGQLVKQGELLFMIDPRPFQTALDQAKANLEQARATAEFASGDLTRAKQLVRDKTISEQVFDQRLQAERVAQSTVQAREAAVRQAELDIQFTELRSPISGRIGDRRVSEGNLVTGGTGGSTTLLATIVSTNPIWFEFTLDEASYLRYVRQDGRDITKRGAASPVSLKLIDDEKFSYQGQMDFVDNVIDRSSGTIRMRAEFKNPDNLFTPGMFGRIQVAASPPYQALTVPDAAIGSEQARRLVYVVTPENIAQIKYVELGSIENGRRVIRSGLTRNESVIVNGMARARPGITVTPQQAPAKDSEPPQASNAKAIDGAAPTQARTD